MFSRRDFIKVAAAASGVGFSSTVHSLISRRQEANGYFGVHPFVENHPEAVFIMRTHVDEKTNSEAKLQAGLDFARSVMVPMSEGNGGVPLTHYIPVKPNLTCRGKWDSLWTEEETRGVVTDPYFVEGVIEGMKELGLEGSRFYIREVNCPEDWIIDGYGNPWEHDPDSVAGRTGAEIRDMTKEVGLIDEADVVWMDVPDGVYFNKIPYLWPINTPDSWLLNIAKLKSHGMGVTLSIKNLQGTVVHNYQRFGSGYRQIDMKAEHMQPNALVNIRDNYYENHKKAIPRFDKPGTSFNSGLGMDVWANQTIDNLSATKPGLNVIEGIFGRDGNGFVRGPGPDGLAQDFMTNIIIFGMNPFYIDNIGHWLGAHEPGNFGVFHIAVERGLAQTFNPHEIPVYEWFSDGTAKLTPLENFERTPLMTYYLQRDYDGQNEPYYHLCNEPYEYAPTKVEEQVEPKAIVLNQNFPNPFNPNTSIEYSIPSAGHARLEVYSSTGQLIEVLVDSYCQAGIHMAVWNTENNASGIYFYRLQFGAFSDMKKMTLVK